LRRARRNDGAKTAVGRERDECPHIAQTSAVIAGLLLADIGPNFVNLNTTARQIAHGFGQRER
jgi:hypothetical protein